MTLIANRMNTFCCCCCGWSKQWNNKNLLTLKASNTIKCTVRRIRNALFNCRYTLRDCQSQSILIRFIRVVSHSCWIDTSSGHHHRRRRHRCVHTKPIVNLSSIIIIFSAFTQSTKLIALMTIFCYCRCCFYCCCCFFFFFWSVFVLLSVESCFPLMIF